MNLSLKFRDRLYSIGAWLTQEMDQLIAAITSTWDTNHLDDGTHGDIQAKSLTVTKGTPQEVASGVFSGAITTDGLVTATGDGTHSFTTLLRMLGEFGIIDIGRVGATTWNDSFLSSGIKFGTLDSTTSRFLFGIRDAAGAGDIALVLADSVLGGVPFMWRRQTGVYYFQPGPATVFTGGVVINLGNPNDANARGYFAGIYGKQFFRPEYASAQGEWTAFTPTMTASAGTWTGGFQDCFYTLIGKTVHVSIYVAASSNSAAAATLFVGIPGGFTVSHTMFMNAFMNEGAGTAATQGLMAVSAGGTVIQISRFDGANFAINVNTLYVRSEFVFEVQ